MEVLGSFSSITKYIMRVAHIGCMVFICHKTIKDFWLGQQTFDYAYYYMVLGALVLISGTQTPKIYP